MKILYIISAINNQGGVARVLATKTNYFVENFGYEVIIVTENNGNEPLFFEFNPKIKIIDIKLSKNKVAEIIGYKTKIQNIINEQNPNYIITSSFHFKSFLIPYLLKTKIPIVFEPHGSKFNEELFIGSTIYHTFRRKIKVLYRGFLANKFDFSASSSDHKCSFLSLNLLRIISAESTLPTSNSNLAYVLILVNLKPLS